MSGKEHVTILCLSLLLTTFVWPPSQKSAIQFHARPRPQCAIAEGWAIQSSAQVPDKGETISRVEFVPKNWYTATVPSTVLAALVANKVYPDPYFGMNLRSIPGASYPIGHNFSNLPMPAESPFRVPWWYRKEFQLRKREGEYVWLHFEGINYRANIWLNGRQIADSKQVAGAYRIYEFNITDAVVPGKNVLAVEVFPPQPEELAINWVDWNPAPPDKNMGIWRDVYLTFSGPVALRHPHVVTRLDLPSLKTARLTVTAELRNASREPVQATLTGQIEQIRLAQTVTLAPQETRTVTFSPEQFPQLVIAETRLWWPWQMGPQNLYDLHLQVDVKGQVSDQQVVRFGIRQVSSELTEQNYRLYRINGQPILIRGGGWAHDMLLRPSPQRELQELRYVKDLGLNAIRFEGQIPTSRFLEHLDREGILAILGWCCCDHWEKWERWDSEDYEVAAESLKSQILRVRNHPSVIAWWYGSDYPPTRQAEERYLEVLKATNWPNPFQSSANPRSTPLTGPTGVTMGGAYEYVPPIFWYVAKRGGAFGFNTETSPGPAVPPVESLRKFLPEDHLWPIDEYWNFHAGGGMFQTLKIFTEALNARYGTATSVEDYARKAQMMSYESQRAMFEAYARNKYTSTGVIQWMLNDAWPSLIWHLYDYYLRPGGGYFGVKKACEPLHIQYSYDDRSVVVVNGYYREFKNLKATAKVYNLDLTEKFSKQTTLDVAPDSSQRLLVIPEIEGITSTYFVRLSLEDATGKVLSSNFYWLSTQPDVLDEAKAAWYYTPAKSYADFTALKDLPAARLKVSATSNRRGTEEVVRVSLENPGPHLAFFVRLRITRGRGGEEVLPILWQDNYVSLLPGEKRELTATYQIEDLQGSTPVVAVDGWNVTPRSHPVRR